MRSGTHAALMDSVYRRQRYVYDLTRKYYLFGRDRLIRELALRPGESLVEVGCGTARNLIKIAHAYPGALLYGLDASQEMLGQAAHAIERAGLSGRIKLVLGYAEDLDPRQFGRDKAFDRVVFSYSLSMIPDWKQALKSAAAALSPGGSLHIVDFGDLRGLGRLAERALRRWLLLFHVEPRDDILKALETRWVQNPSETKGLRILLGRYAFVFRCNADIGRTLAG